jgi:hypothetical protein
MRLTRKLLVSGAVLVAGLVLTATPAYAQIEVFSEPGDGGCGEVTISAHVVSGGCHVEAESLGSVALVAYVPQPVVISSCDVYAEGYVGQDGAGYITEVNLTTPTPPPEPPCTRTPCDHEGPGMIPWEASIGEEVGSESVEVTFCLRPIMGTGSGTCTVHMPLFTDNTHDWHVGNSSEYFCEASNPYPMSIEGDFGTVPDGETGEVVH